MAFLQKTWKDRVAEYINRRVLTKEDGTTELVSVERSEGTISQEGDAFSAANMNDLEQRIANEFSEQNKNLGGLRFGVDGEGNGGYFKADDSFVPFKSSNFSLIATGRMDGDNVSSKYTFTEAYDNVFCILNASDDRRALVNVALASSNSSLSKSQVYTFDEWEQSRCIKTIYGTLEKVKVGDTITFTGKWTCAYMIFSL